MGTALLPRVRLYSDPALPDNQTLAWLLLGRPAPDTGAEAAMLQTAALALLGGREGRGLAASFGLDELSFSGGGDGEIASASVTLGKRLSDRLYAGSPAQGGQFEAGAGELSLSSPAPTSQALVAWGPARWRAGELSTTGRLTGLPLQWVERVASGQLAEAGVTGNVVFNGDWDATLGRTLRVNANLFRASGDLTLLTTDAQTGVQSRVPAGLREARLTLDSQGEALNLRLKWDSAQAGTVDGQLRTELSAAHDDVACLLYTSDAADE